MLDIPKIAGVLGALLGGEAPEQEPIVPDPAPTPEPIQIELAASELAGTTFSDEWQRQLETTESGSIIFDVRQAEQHNTQSQELTPEQEFKRAYPNLSPVWDGDSFLARDFKGKAVEDLQRLLNSLDADLAQDGHYGPKTEAAVLAFQKQHSDLTNDGIAGENTVKKAFSVVQNRDKEAKNEVGEEHEHDHSSERETPQQTGLDKQAVKAIQAGLNRAMGMHLTEDGAFGRQSQFAMAMYQLSRGLEVSGSISQESITALQETRPELESWDHRSLPQTTQRGFLKGTPYFFTARSIGPFTMSEDTAKAFVSMFKEARKSGVTLMINSAFRTNEEQTRLYDDYKRGVGALAARPGYSNHQSGIAIDLNVGGWKGQVYQWLEKHAADFEFTRTVKNEPWHWETPRNGLRNE